MPPRTSCPGITGQHHYAECGRSCSSMVVSYRDGSAGEIAKADADARNGREV